MTRLSQAERLAANLVEINLSAAASVVEDALISFLNFTINA